MNLQEAEKTLKDGFRTETTIYKYISNGEKDEAEKCVSIVWDKISKIHEDGCFNINSPELLDTVKQLFKGKESDYEAKRELNGILVLLLNYYDVIEYSGGYHPNDPDKYHKNDSGNLVMYIKRLKNGKLKKIKI